jgi:hypothetical protein
MSATVVDEPMAASSHNSIFKLLMNAVSDWEPLKPSSLTKSDFANFLTSAKHHGVLPIVASRLLQHSGAGVDRNLLHAVLKESLMRSFPLVEEILRITDRFRAEGVPLIPYKGPAMAEDLWGSFSLRECSDIDFLIQPADIERAGEILQLLGYSRVSTVAAHLRPALLRNASEEQFRHESGILLELQWAPAPKVLAASFDIQSLWKNCREIDFAGGRVLAPSPEDLMLLLCVHGWKHNWSRLIWIADVARLIRQHPLDWNRIELLARGSRNSGIVALGIQMAHLAFGIELPHGVKVQPQIGELAAKLFDGMRSEQSLSYLQWHRFMLAARDGYRECVEHVFRFLFTPGIGEYQAINLPRWASAGYRAIRVGRVLKLLPSVAAEE